MRKKNTLEEKCLCKFATFVVTDTMEAGLLTKYVLNEVDTFYAQDDKMFFWDKHYQEYIMYYDFNATSSYDIKFYDPFRKSDEIATVFIDSIGYRHFGTIHSRHSIFMYSIVVPLKTIRK
ncbi:MAG: hypothetical protein IPK46_22640 [Saprospiraceae bacterium]|nr:hypothetical protein [Saprospiraceae bacterium]